MRSKHILSFGKIVVGNIVLLFILVFPAQATKPCGADSYFSGQNKSLEEWIESSQWVAKVKVTNVRHQWQPYPNCYLENKDECAMENVASFNVEILEVIKGDVNARLNKLEQAYCAKTIPEGPGDYIFYGHNPGQYIGYEIVGEESLVPIELKISSNLRLRHGFDYTNYYGILNTSEELARLWSNLINIDDEVSEFNKWIPWAKGNVPSVPDIDFNRQMVFWYAPRGSHASFVKDIEATQTPNEMIITVTVFHSDFGSSELKLWTLPKIVDKKIVVEEKHETESRGRGSSR